MSAAHETSRSGLPAMQPPGMAETRLQEYLTFSLGMEEYAIDILKVQEIRVQEATTRIAGAPDAFAGVVNLRGSIVPVADLGALIGLERAKSEKKVVIILRLSGQVIGMLVDQVNDVLAIAAETIQPLPPMVALSARHARGIGVDNGRMLIILDAESLLNGTDLPTTETV
jgi:purine-binding chemotaxis protein CheW